MNKPNHPDEIVPGKTEYSIWADWKVNGWLIVATCISAFCDIIFRSRAQQWPVALKATVEIFSFLAILLWMRNLSRWIQCMDELHRRITLEAVLFTSSATFFVVMLWHRLDQAGVFSAIFPRGRGPAESWDIGTITHIYLLLTFFYFLGSRISTRRYQ